MRPIYIYTYIYIYIYDISSLRVKTRDRHFVSDVFKYGFEESVLALGEGEDKDGDCSLYMSVYYGDANKQYKVGGSKCCFNRCYAYDRFLYSRFDTRAE